MGKQEDRPARPDRFTRATMAIVVTRLGEGFIAQGSLAGVIVRGNRGRTEVEALSSLFMQYTQGVNPDAALALDLASTGETMQDVEGQFRQALTGDVAPPAPAPED